MGIGNDLWNYYRGAIPIIGDYSRKVTRSIVGVYGLCEGFTDDIKFKA